MRLKRSSLFGLFVEKSTVGDNYRRLSRQIEIQSAFLNESHCAFLRTARVFSFAEDVRSKTAVVSMEYLRFPSVYRALQQC